MQANLELVNFYLGYTKEFIELYYIQLTNMCCFWCG